MSTIATDGITIAGDGLGATDGGIIMARSLRKIEGYPGRIYAFAGMTRSMRPVIDWHRNGAIAEKYPVKPDDESATLLVLTAKSAILYSDSPLGELCEFPMAIGNGKSIAMAALLLGHSPREAIELASRLDVWTGGEIQVVRLADYLGDAPGKEVLNGHHPEGHRSPAPVS